MATKIVTKTSATTSKKMSAILSGTKNSSNESHERS